MFKIFLPSVEEISNESSNTRLSSPSPPPLSTGNKSTAQIEEVSKRKSGLTRSSTETQISSLQKSKNVSSSPFSVLLPLTSNQQITKNNTILEHDDYEVEKSNDLNMNQKRHRYSVDFLLQRSDVPNSKKFPPNWKNLNEKFPAICFCGKVIFFYSTI